MAHGEESILQLMALESGSVSTPAASGQFISILPPLPSHKSLAQMTDLPESTSDPTMLVGPNMNLLLIHY